MKHHLQNAFSLVELSIVLVILGLLTGGILTGQSLIKAAELRTITKDAETFATAIHTFKSKYFALPGDMNNATQFWGTRASCVQSSISTYSAGNPPAFTISTCSGDGDGVVGIKVEDYNYEILHSWQHLTNAGLINGSYSGLSLSSSAFRFYHDPGVNCPKSPAVSSGCWGIMWSPSNGSYGGGYAEELFLNNGGNLLILGATNPNHLPTRPVLTTENMWNIDKKADDGLPDKGKIRPLENQSGGTNCYQTVSGVMQYKLADTSNACQVIIHLN